MRKKFVENFQVIENKTLNPTNFLIRLKSSITLPELHPGQFVNIEVKNSSETFLRRPFSIFEYNKTENSISLIVKILGQGSKKLTESEVGDTLSLIFPLGKSFTYPDVQDRILLVGGGSGVAPLLFLAKQSGLPSTKVDILLGAKTVNDHINVNEYEQYSKFHFSTEDGSIGESGFVTHHSIFVNQLNDYDKIYACGPDGMMKAVAKAAQASGIFCEVSLENLMACGFGVCLCCIEPTVDGNLCVCTEGPVFNINKLKW